MFIDPTFFGVCVCGPLQSFVVDVCTNINPAKGTTLGTVLLSKKVERTNMLQYFISEARGSNVELNISLFTVPFFSV